MVRRKKLRRRDSNPGKLGAVASVLTTVLHWPLALNVNDADVLLLSMPGLRLDKDSRDQVAAHLLDAHLRGLREAPRRVESQLQR